MAVSNPVYRYVHEDNSNDTLDDEIRYGNRIRDPPNVARGTVVGIWRKYFFYFHGDRCHQPQVAILLLFLCVVLIFADQNLMAPNLSAIAESFGFNDDERDRKLGGDIALAFFLLGAPASFVIGSLADHYNRVLLFTLTVIGGEGACFASYWIRTYRQLYFCRAITGLSMGGALPLIYSILGDLFAAEDRHTAASNVSVGMGAGIALGQIIAGFLGPRFGWRLPFLVVSIPAMMCAVAFYICVDEPERGAMEEVVRISRLHNENALEEDDMPPLANDELSGEILPLECDKDNATEDKMSGNVMNVFSSAQSLWNGIRQQLWSCLSLLSTPTLVFALLQGAPGCVPWGIVNTYLNDFLSADRGMSVEYATIVVSMFGLGNFFGMLVGGYGGAYMYRLDIRFPALLGGFAATLGCVPFWLLLNTVTSDSALWTVVPISMSAGLCSGVTGPIIKATLQNVTMQNTRGQAFALFNTFDDLGRGLGPLLVSILITQFGGRTPAFNIGVLGWAVCGILNLCVFYTVRYDEHLIQSKLAANLSQMHFDDARS
jgi:MFS family permease